MNFKLMNRYFVERKIKFVNRSIDDNVVTYLIRNVLGSEYRQILYYFFLFDNVCRIQRDDMIVFVIFFDSDYIKDKNVFDGIIKK